MDLLMMRHAEACGLGGDIQSDRDRTLTDRGIEQMESIFSQLSDKRAVIDAIVCSPYVRCVQTAVHLGQRFGLAEVYPNPILAPFGGVPDIGPILDQFLKKSLLLVGHHPDIGLLAHSLNAPEMNFVTGTLVWFRWDPYDRQWRYHLTLVPRERP